MGVLKKKEERTETVTIRMLRRCRRRSISCVSAPKGRRLTSTRRCRKPWGGWWGRCGKSSGMSSAQRRVNRARVPHVMAWRKRRGALKGLAAAERRGT